MLVLTRKPEESIVINGNIIVTILNVEGDRVSVGINAPKDVKIFRSELLDETRKLNKESINLPENILGGVKKKK